MADKDDNKRRIDAFIERGPNLHEHVQMTVADLFAACDVGSLAVVQCIYLNAADDLDSYSLCAHVLCARIETVRGYTLLPLCELSSREIAGMRPPPDPKIAVVDPKLVGAPVEVYQDEHGTLHVREPDEKDDDEGSVH